MERMAGMMNGPVFDPGAAAAAAVRADAKAAEGDTDTRWRDHLIGAVREAPAEAPAAAPVPLNPFQGFLLDLATALEDGSLEGGEGRTGLELSLYFMDRSSGQERAVLCRKLNRSPEECMKEGLPDLETLALDYALEAGPWGAYRWNIKGWVRGEQSLATSQRIHLMQPAGWKPRTQAPEEASAPAPDPLAQLRGTLDVARLMREALGLGGHGGPDPAALQSLTAAAEMKARYEMSEAHRRELDKVREEHRKDLEKLREELAEARRQLQEKDFELRLPAFENPGVFDKLLGVLGPERISGLVGAATGWLVQKSAQPQRPPAKVPARTRPDLRPAQPPAQAPMQANIRPLQRPAAAPPEPPRAQAVQAVGLLGAAAAAAEDPDIRRYLEGLAAEGMQEGPLGSWWAKLTSPADPSQPQGPSWLDFAVHMASQDEEEEEDGDTEEPMDLEALKAQLITRLDEGAADETILEEIRATFTPAQLDQARAALRFVPNAMLGGLLDAPRHQARLAGLRDKLAEG